MKLSAIAVSALALALVLPVQAQETLNPSGGDYSLTEAPSSDTTETSRSQAQQRRATYDAWESLFCSSVSTANFCSTNGSIYGSQAD